MKFFTRELYQASQDGSGVPTDVAAARWNDACAEYDEHFASIQDALPESVREFARETSLHDGIVASITHPMTNTIVLHIDGKHCCLERGQFELQFDGVHEVHGISESTGGWWLYDEVDLHPKAAFEYRVLFAESELRIAADSLKFKVLVRYPHTRPTRVQQGSD